MLDLHKSKCKNLKIKNFRVNITTGGDSGSALDGLKTIYYDPETYLVLPYRHRCTDDNTEVITGFFIPSYAALDLPEIVDSRGVVDEVKAREHY
nr:MAG TPA: hypothetical protein [Bacteriophage sp.]